MYIKKNIYGLTLCCYVKTHHWWSQLSKYFIGVWKCFFNKKKSYTFCKVIDKPKDAILLPDSKRWQNICNPVSWSSSSPEKFSKAFNRTLQIYSKESVF